MKAKLNITYFFIDEYLSEGTEVLVFENITADASEVLNSPVGMCYLCEVNGVKEYIPIKFLDITDYTPTKIIDWEQRRFELVKSLSSSICSSIPLESCTDEQIAKVVIGLADNIIKHLKEE